ncbi:SDR family NAD(P)-dependent oxidoreductase [Kutzneria buriramensis]|uniref:NAD(P)-dependent dehydrogenase (Short-subunit alcohol dehydrogenase family) n=1 Tax=Kutzneria buriramensis TaxID=1045776 RepID=A0A3E0H0T0_9PSEU|nr:SDR family NAD(P)-dependent oxidoreductase [Kutzneria buriramensis]REH35659.1 NAD(P)-dependent dehydrogenase (short-subunit alcohol dehydrogenase family) [Kutzneria buriramensis]
MTTPHETSSAARVALVTGANKGIGRAIAAELATLGFVTYVGARDAQRGAETAVQLSELGDVRVMELDVTSDAQVASAAAQVKNTWDHLDVLVNNAGVNTLNHRPLDHLPKPTEETVEDFRFVYETNVFAVVRMINAFLPLLYASPAGRIVNVTSKRGSIGEPGAWVGQPDMAYSSSKTALNAITVHYARELADTPIKINGAAPGHVATDFNNFRGTRGPAEAAVVAIRLATLPKDGPTGAVFEDEVQLTW